MKVFPDGTIRSVDEWDEGAEIMTRFVRLQWMKATGFGHAFRGLKIEMSDRTYEVQKNGEYRRVA